MRAFASVYLKVAALALVVLFLLQTPGVLILFLVYTMGLGYFIVLPLLYAAFWIVAFAPAALGAWVDWRIGAGVAAVILALGLTFPRWVPDPAHDGVALLEPPFATDGPVDARSVQITAPGNKDAVQAAVSALKRNTDLDWIRVGDKVYERRKGILHEVRASQDKLQRVADVIVSIPERRQAVVWGNAPLSPWQVEDVSGHLIQDTRTGTSLARNLSLKLKRAVKPLKLQVTGVSLDSSADPRVEFLRAPHGEVAQDPGQTLESDLKTLRLWREATDTALEPDNPSNSTSNSVDAVLQEMLMDQELAQHEGHRNRGPDKFERQVIKDFNAQLQARLRVSERIDLIARLERSKIPGLDRTLIIELAEQTPALMQQMVDLYYADLAENVFVYPVLERVARRADYGPLARAIGADRIRFLLALGAADRHQRHFLIESIFTFDVQDPFAILRALFLPRPSGDPLEQRFVENYQATWEEEWRRAEILEYVRSGSEIDKSAMQENADLSLRVLLARKDVPRDVLIGFVEDWVLTRRAPILHDYEVLLEVLPRLEEIGAQELRANLLAYFADLIEFRPHWMDPPT